MPDQDWNIVPANGDRRPVSDNPQLAKKLQALDVDHRLRHAAIDAHLETGQHAIRNITTLADYGHQQYTAGTESMVKRFESVQRSPMAQEPLEDFTRRQIAETGQYVRATVSGAAQRMVAESTRAYDIKEPKRSLADKLLGR